jgi:hypothetical protein
MSPEEPPAVLRSSMYGNDQANPLHADNKAGTPNGSFRSTSALSACSNNPMLSASEIESKTIGGSGAVKGVGTPRSTRRSNLSNAMSRQDGRRYLPGMLPGTPVVSLHRFIRAAENYHGISA